MLEKLLNSRGLCFDIETLSETNSKRDNLHHKTAQIRCVGFATDKTEFAMTWAEIMDEIDLFEQIMTDPKIYKINQNIKFDSKVVSELCGFQVYPLYFDTHVASMLLDENDKHDLESLCVKYLKTTTWKLDYKAEHPIHEWLEHAKNDARKTYDLATYQADQLDSQHLRDLFKVEMEVVTAMYKGELAGVDVDVPYMQKLVDKYTRHTLRVRKCMDRYLIKQNINSISVIRKKAKAVVQENIATSEINYNSPAQLSALLYDTLKYPVLSSTETGKDSTGKMAILKMTREGYEFAKYLSTYRHWIKLCEHIQKLIDSAIEGKIFCTFNTCGTETGRFSCKEPNLQQIPSKTAESLKIRKAFTGPLIVLDYSNVELRLLAHFTRDPKLLAVYREGGSGDLHALTAEKLGISRSHAKTVNFGIGYGMSWKKLSDDLGLDELTSRKYIDDWYRLYSQVTPWKSMICNTMKKYGFVRSIGGRKRRVLDINSSNRYDRFAAERETINFVIQGSSADITKKAIAALKDYDIRMQVHDEIVIADHGYDIEKIRTLAEGVVKLIVPLKVDIKACADWSEMKE